MTILAADAMATIIIIVQPKTKIVVISFNLEKMDFLPPGASNLVVEHETYMAY